jgi:hypothetical protein
LLARLIIMPPATLNLNHFKVVEDMGLKSYCIEIHLKAIASIPNLMKIYQAV